MGSANAKKSFSNKKIRHPVQRRLQVAAQQPDPKPGTGKPDLGTSAPARLHHRSIIASH